MLGERPSDVKIASGKLCLCHCFVSIWHLSLNLIDVSLKPVSISYLSYIIRLVHTVTGHYFSAGNNNLMGGQMVGGPSGPGGMMMQPGGPHSAQSDHQVNPFPFYGHDPSEISKSSRS